MDHPTKCWIRNGDEWCPCRRLASGSRELCGHRVILVLNPPSTTAWVTGASSPESQVHHNEGQPMSGIARHAFIVVGMSSLPQSSSIGTSSLPRTPSMLTLTRTSSMCGRRQSPRAASTGVVDRVVQTRAHKPDP